ncbi:MAG: hypothetical protein IT428_22400 [Planctomycetaceae bacterium]|nr:hypothetical protein [Planctomycetaceae bacterium]
MLPLLRIGLPILLTLLIGCDDDPHSERRQAAENASAARRLIEADAAIRKDYATVARNLSAERTEIGRQRDQLEAERKDLAIERQRAPLIAEGLRSSGLLLLSGLPLILCWALLLYPQDETGAAELEDLLILEVSGIETTLAEPAQVTAAEKAGDPRLLPCLLEGGSAPPPTSSCDSIR